MSSPDEPSQAGFTLLETIVAFMILATVLGAATLSVSYSARLHQRADDLRAAYQFAERLIAEHFETRPDQPGQESGRNGDLAWTIKRWKALEAGGSGQKLIAFDLTISASSGKRLAHYKSFYIEDAP